MSPAMPHHTTPCTMHTMHTIPHHPHPDMPGRQAGAGRGGEGGAKSDIGMGHALSQQSARLGRKGLPPLPPPLCLSLMMNVSLYHSVTVTGTCCCWLLGKGQVGDRGV